MASTIIGAHADKNFIPFHLITLSKSIHQGIAGRFRIQPERIRIHIIQTFRHFRRRRIWVLIGVQFDQILYFWLFARHVGTTFRTFSSHAFIGISSFFPASVSDLPASHPLHILHTTVYYKYIRHLSNGRYILKRSTGPFCRMLGNRK